MPIVNEIEMQNQDKFYTKYSICFELKAERISSRCVALGGLFLQRQ